MTRILNNIFNAIEMETALYGKKMVDVSYKIGANSKYYPDFSEYIIDKVKIDGVNQDKKRNIDYAKAFDALNKEKAWNTLRTPMAIRLLVQGNLVQISV